MEILIRADASTVIGTGHVMRCLALAEEFVGRGHAVTFASQALPGDLRRYVADIGFQQVTVPDGAPTDDAAACLSLVGRADAVIVDHYGLDAEWERYWLPTSRVLAIDDRANRLHACHALLDQNYYVDAESRYSKLVPKAAACFLGPRYALLRKEFRTRPKRTRDGSVQRILVLYGGSDPTGETLVAIRGLGGLTGLVVKVVCGPAMASVTEIENLATQHPDIEVIGPTREVAALMDWADLCLGAGGSTGWERCHRGLPALVTSVSDDQHPIAADLATTGAIIHLGRAGEVDAETIRAAIENLRRSPREMQRMTTAAQALVPGDGAEIVADWLTA